ncbi:MAG: phage portal protein [Parvibaculum sp.]
MPILDANGAPMRPRASTAEPAYRAGSATHADLASFNPPSVSSDAAVLRSRTKMSARAHDLVRNDGWASTAVNRWVNGIIGKGWKLQAKPDWRALGLTREWADEFANEVEGHWRSFVNDQRFNCDYERYTDFAGLMRLMARHWAVDNEALVVLRWRDERGLAPYHLALEVIDPDRLSTPYGLMEGDLMRAGVELSAATREPVAYHVRAAHPGDQLASPSQFRWLRLARETSWGRPLVVHAFERVRAGATRPASRFAPIIQKLKQLTRYDETELQAAIINATFAAYIETPLDADSFAATFGGGLAGNSVLDNVLNHQAAYHEKVGFSIGGARLHHLVPGEQIKTVASTHPNSVFSEFEEQSLRYISAALDISYEQLANDWSKTNYSSARAAMLEVRMGLDCAKQKIETLLANPIYTAFVEELIRTDRVMLPARGPDFDAARTAYCTARWIGAGRGWVDPVKEAQGAAVRIETGLSTLQAECAELGLDWEEVLAQRALEIAKFEELGLPVPSVLGVLALATKKELEGQDA